MKNKNKPWHKLIHIKLQVKYMELLQIYEILGFLAFSLEVRNMETKLYISKDRIVFRDSMFFFFIICNMKTN